MNETLKKLLTGKDNETPDIARHSWAYSMLMIFMGAAWNAYHTLAVDLSSIANAIALIVGAHGAAIFAKAKTEPDAAQPTEGEEK